MIGVILLKVTLDVTWTQPCIYIYIYKLKHNIYYYYTPVKPHQWPYQLPIFNHFTLLFLAMVFLLPFHLSTTLNLNVTLYLSCSLLFILSLLIPFCYYKFVILSLSFYIYFPTQKWLFISLSLSLSHVLFLCEFFIFCISTL